MGVDRYEKSTVVYNFLDNIAEINMAAELQAVYRPINVVFTFYTAKPQHTLLVQQISEEIVHLMIQA